MSDRDPVDLGIPDLQDAVEVGAGGFGTVYRARQASLHRDVAVKMVNNTVKDEKVRIRFEREIQAMGMLSGHPNIVTVYDSGFTGSGQPYILMDYMEQGSLGDRLLSEGPLPWTEVVELMVKVCGALETAHQAGVLHRDLKPENVLVSGYGEPKLGDFGIARLKGGPETGTASLTASIEHVSPDLLEGQQPSVASDIYALGSTMFKLLTGRAAFVRPEDESIIPALTRIRDEPVPDLRARGVPDPLADVVERAMAKDPAHRFGSAVEMGRALREAQRALGLAVTPMPVREEDAAAARESTRTIVSDELARSMDALGLAGHGAAQPGTPTGPPAGAPTGAVGPPPAPGLPSQGYPSQGYAVPGYPSQGHPAPGYPSQGYAAPPPTYPTGAPTGPVHGGYPPPSGGSKGWVPIAAGLGALVVVGGIAAALALGGGGGGEDPPPSEDEGEEVVVTPSAPPRTADPTPTDEPSETPSATPTGYAAYENVVDDSGDLLVSAPREWSDVDGTAWEVDGREIGQELEVAPSVADFRASWNTPGLIFGASEELQSSFDPAGLADAVSFADQCTYDGRTDYSDAFYTGVRDDYSDCGGTDTSYVVVAAENAAQSRIVLVQVQVVDERDLEALDRVLASFEHMGDRTADAAASPSATPAEPGTPTPTPTPTQ
jgi:serine/threonine-protein kinase PknK